MYYVDVIKQGEKRSDGSEIHGTGEYHIRELECSPDIFDLKTSRPIEFANEIVNQLNSFNYPQYKEGDLVQLSLLIRRYLQEWIGNNGRDGKIIGNYNDAVYCVLGRIMKDSKGHLNPSVVESLIKIEREVWEGTDICLPC